MKQGNMQNNQHIKEEMALVAGCINKDPLMQKKLYDKYKNAMYSLAYRITSNPEEAKDALQDGFIEVFKNLHHFNGPYGLSKWIKTIILRRSIKFVKKYQTDMEDLDKVEPQMQIIWPVNLNGEILHNAIDSLEGYYKSVFVLIEVEGYSHAEVASMLELSENNSKVMLHRAKKMLRERLKDLVQ